MIETLELGDTIQFTFQSSVQPDSAPSVALYRSDQSTETLINSMTSVTSDVTHYFGVFTMPESDQFVILEWNALSTLNGTQYPFVKRMLFNVAKTRGPR